MFLHSWMGWLDRVLQVAKDQASLVKDKIVDFNSMSAVKEGEKASEISPVKDE